MSALIGHSHILRELRALAAQDDWPHALLFAGAEGTGRATLARYWLQLLTCERRHAPPPAGASLFGDEPAAGPSDAEPCGTCRHCRLISEGAHPDMVTVAPGDTLCTPRAGDTGHARHPDSRDIRICQVRGIIDLVARYPFEAPVRGIIIDPTEKITVEAANTLLKTLEEPPGHTAFVLLSGAPELLLETVLSRCRRIDVRPVPTAEIEAGLLARGIAPGVAARAAAEARGRPGRALHFAAHPDEMDDRARLLERCLRLAGDRFAARSRYAESLAERWRQDRSLVLGELDVWEAFWEGRLREAVGSGDDDSARGALEALRAVATARADLQANVQVRAALELMLIAFPHVKMEPHEAVAQA